MTPQDLTTSQQSPSDTAPRREAEEAIGRYVAHHDITLDERTESWRIEGQGVSSATLAERVWAHNIHLPIKLFQVILQERARRLRDAAASRIRDKLLPLGRPERTNAALDELIALTSHEGCSEETLRYYRLAWRQFVWQVKRRMVGRTTSAECMLLLTGPQGTGKSTLMRAFCEPLSFLYLPDATFAVFSDAFRQHVFERYYLILLDEMERGSATDVEAIKRVITAPYLQSRAMRTQQEVNYNRNASFLGASNFGLSTHIKDTTGMRRFVEIQFRVAPVDASWLERLKNLDVLGIWQSVSADTNIPPLLEDRELVGTHQARLVTSAAFDLWHEECVCRDGEDARVTLKDVWGNYLQWCDRYRERPLGRGAFKKKLDARVCSYRPNNITTYKGIRLSTSAFT